VRSRIAGAAVLALLANLAFASSFDYGLKPQTLAPGVHLFEGAREHFSRSNGGNILNTGYLETSAGAVVIDTGPSRRYGEQQRRLIEAQTGKAVAQVLLTHAHPDHFLGNQAYAGVPIAALPATTQAIARGGEDLSANLYRLVGGWMEGTEALAPTQAVQDGAITIGGRRLRLIALHGHTEADLAVFDEQTRTLFAGDLVFFRRTPTTPNADIGAWLSALDALEKLDVAILVPGHGPVVRDGAAIAQTRAYLRWLRNTLRAAAQRGLDLNEAMQVEVPPEFAKLAVFGEEFQRSVVHLYPAMELETLRAAGR
jgi:uncharacterized sulfatase